MDGGVSVEGDGGGVEVGVVDEVYGGGGLELELEKEEGGECK